MDSGALSIMVPAFAECLVLVGIHSYLGLHVIKRKVIFVDLALAQIAALGATVGFLFGMDPTSTAAFLFSMVFTFLGAAVFALTRLRHDRIPQEAVIGLVYAMATAVAILVVDKSPQGAEHIKDLLTGTILWVKWPTILTAAVAYAFVGVFHFVLRHPFIRITEDPHGAFVDGMWVRFWDFLFYLSFGFVISFSVRTAGVLLVFVFLVAPAITAVLFTRSWRRQLIIGWTMGTGVTTVALYLSYTLDLPSGPTVVSFYGLVLLVVAMVAHLVRAEARGRAAGKLAVGLGIAGVVLGSLWLFGTVLGASSWAEDPNLPHRHGAVHASVGHPHHGAAGHHALTHGDRGAAASAAPDPDPMVRVARITRAARAGTAGWRRALVKAVLDPDLPLLFKQDLLDLLKHKAGETFGYDAEAEQNGAAARKMKAWAARKHGGTAPSPTPPSR